MENQPTEVNMVEICGNFKKETRSYEDSIQLLFEIVKKAIEHLFLTCKETSEE